MDGVQLQHNSFPHYVGIPMDKRLTFKPHLENLAQKLKCRNNLMFGNVSGMEVHTSLTNVSSTNLIKSIKVLSYPEKGKENSQSFSVRSCVLWRTNVLLELHRCVTVTTMLISR